MNRIDHDRTIGSIRVQIEGLNAYLEGPVPFELVSSLLEVAAYEFKSGGPRGYRRRVITHQLSHRESDGTVCVPTGTLLLVCQELEAAGFEIQFDPSAAGIERLLRPFVMQDGDDNDFDPLASVLLENKRGLIVYRDAVDRTARIEQICKTYPNARTLILTHNRSEAHAEYKRLFRPLMREIYMMNEWEFSSSKKRLIAPIRRLGVALASDWDLIIAEADPAIAPSLRNNLLRLAPSCRVYGLRDSNGHSSRRMDFLLCMAFGPTLNEAFPITRSTAVHWYTPTWEAEPDRSLDAIAFKRAAVWHNTERNRQIAEIATAVTTVDLASLERLGLLQLAADLEGLPDWRPRVVAICETIEHQNSLSRLLPTWETFALETSEQPRQWGFIVVDWCGRGGVIATALAVRKLGLLGAEIVLHCRGGVGAARIPNLSEANREYAGPFAVIDFADGESLARDTQSRFDDYRDSGFRSVGAPQWLDHPCHSR